LHDTARSELRNSGANIPLAADKGSGRDRPFFATAFQGQARKRFVPPGSARNDQFLEDLQNSVRVMHQAVFMTAPSMTTPALTYFHSATSSLRASAIIVVFLRRPLFCLTRC